MPEFVTVATVEEIPPGTGRTVEVQGVWIALFNVDGSFYAVDNTCPHAGGPLGEGHLEGHVVECPWHGWQFNVQTGERPENPNITVACCPVRIEGNQVQVALPENFTVKLLYGLGPSRSMAIEPERDRGLTTACSASGSAIWV